MTTVPPQDGTQATARASGQRLNTSGWKNKLLESKRGPVELPYSAGGSENWDNQQTECLCPLKEEYRNIHSSVMQESKTENNPNVQAQSSPIVCAHNRRHSNEKGLANATLYRGALPDRTTTAQGARHRIPAAI